jgi:hypothetical protein
LAKAGLTLGQMDVIESNEAFAAQALGVNKELGMDAAKVNPNGGAAATAESNLRWQPQTRSRRKGDFSLTVRSVTDPLDDSRSLLGFIESTNGFQEHRARH